MPKAENGSCQIAKTWSERNEIVVCEITILSLSLFLLAPLITLPAHAQDICSSDGKSKMRSVSISEAQISKLCPVIASSGATPSIDYRGSHAAMIDGKDAVGKVISFTAEIEFVSTDSNGRPQLVMSSRPELNLWRVYFDKEFKSAVSDLEKGQWVSIVCRITKVVGERECSLIKMAGARN